MRVRGAHDVSTSPPVPRCERAGKPPGRRLYPISLLPRNSGLPLAQRASNRRHLVSTRCRKEKPDPPDAKSIA